MIKKRKTVMKKKKLKQMKCDYPEIVAKLSLLVGGGNDSQNGMGKNSC